MDTSEVPADVAAAIKQCWPNGVVEEFATDESYFHEVRPRLERDLRNIRGAALLWQTEEEEIGARSNEDENDGPHGWVFARVPHCTSAKFFGTSRR
jgi:hypothetical protein